MNKRSILSSLVGTQVRVVSLMENSSLDIEVDVPSSYQGWGVVKTVSDDLFEVTVHGKARYMYSIAHVRSFVWKA
jgi:hypothetical protein